MHFLICRRIDDSHVNGNGISDEYGSTSNNELSPNTTDTAQLLNNKRPVSMFEARDGSFTSKQQQNHENRTANSMYQMVDGQLNEKHNNDGTTMTTKTATTNGSIASHALPHSDDVKFRTEIVTRRIQELWSLMQEMSSNDVFVPGAEKVSVAVSDLTALFPTVNPVLLIVKLNLNSIQ